MRDVIFDRIAEINQENRVVTHGYLDQRSLKEVFHETSGLMPVDDIQSMIFGNFTLWPVPPGLLRPNEQMLVLVTVKVVD